ncbi:hypothetical protein N7541_005640 [Penicillium brevicompactum]|uniref:Zn(2)-C6 fungal-type domain-containing protein n=1 Tax=Penicillium brevicompactum TaxID=5074 RepID=A0A9W9UTX3_PENBR|nr:hypothetical protein N7541_005640 [Penicillium brevicompactum]
MSTTIAPDSRDIFFECDFPECNSRYRRKEHLKRHQVNHETYAAIADLLRRHIRKYHPQAQLPGSRSLKACTACRQRKETCERGVPCKACQRRGLNCSLAGQASPERHIRNADEPNLTVQESPSTDEYVESYFQHFHPEWPFLHRSTFDPATEPRVLVQSVVMIGMWAYGSKDSKNAAIDLHCRLGSAMQNQRSQWDFSTVTSDQIIDISWPITTYQSLLLHVILSILITKETGDMDLGLRHRIPADEYDLFDALVRSCRNLGMFSYPKMLAQYPTATPITMIWVGVEEMKRFALALYKVAHISTTGDRNESACEKLLTIADLSFSMPYCDEVWNIPRGSDTRSLVRAIAETRQDENTDDKEWISTSSTTLHDDRVNFKWI